MYAVIFGFLFFLLLVVTIFGRVPLSVAIVDFTVKRLGIPFEGAVFTVVLFWSLIVYVGVFIYRAFIRVAEESTVKSRVPQDVRSGAFAILAFCVAIVYLILEHGNETNAQSIKMLVLDFVKNNEAVMREVGASEQASLVSWQTGRDGSGTYDVEVRGTKTIYAIVEASRKSSTAQFTLVCTTPLYIGQRDPFKHPCKQ